MTRRSKAQLLVAKLPHVLRERCSRSARALSTRFAQRLTCYRKPRVHVVYAFTQGDECLALRVSIASSFASRFIGLLRHKKLEDHEGMLFVPGGAIHTIGMRFPIDVVFLDREMRILKVKRELKPWRIATAPRNTKFVLELAAGRTDVIVSC